MEKIENVDTVVSVSANTKFIEYEFFDDFANNKQMKIIWIK